ncbi:uncharacterized protein At1g01500 [Silene latifolia]|uniref:uncharacterized protein At1g01500 n=1 Tax=Silene latifolia TaxID=37657 RepID=UPI003D774D04
MCPSMDSTHLTLTIPKPPPFTTTTTTTTPHNSSIWFETRLFYIRISPCAISTVPDHLTLRHIRDELGVSLEINAARIAASSAASTTLRRDRVDSDASEVTYVSTDTVRINGGIEFEVYDGDNLILCGSLCRLEDEWSMECFPAAGGGTTSFCQPKLGISSPCFEVYIAGRWADAPVILTKMVSFSPRRKSPKYSTLDSIPEVSDDVEKDRKVVSVPSSLIRQRNLQVTGSEDEYDPGGKMAHGYYPDDVYIDEDGQLSWFNTGVRVGVGIGLGMCLGLGIGVGLLMRSYQTTTRNFRRRFF